jgi:putative DNA primase/helicase
MPKNTITPPVEKVGNAEDESTGDAFEIFRFRKVSGENGEIRIPRDKARDCEFVNGLLVLKNADLPYPNESSLPIVLEAIKKPANEQFLYAARLGWRPDRTAFVPARGKPIGQDGSVKLLAPTWLNERQNVGLGRSGTLDDWIKRIAKPSGNSRVAMLVLSAAFAAPLLETTGLQSFGINIHGPAKVGKTAVLLVGASVAGIGRESQLPNWAATPNATSELARLFSDTMLPANEVGLLAGKKKDAYGHIRELIYRLSEGRDKARHSSWKETPAASNAQFRTIFVSTAEHSFDDYAAYAGEKRDEGEYARCIDVAATKPDLPSVMTKIPKTHTSDAKTWARKQVIALREACEEQHGTALRPYIEFLIEQGPGLKDKVAKYQAEFMKKVKGAAVEGAIEHAARNVSLVYAGGRLGIEAKLLPWDPGRLLKAIAACFRSSLGEIEYHQSAEKRAVSALKRALGKANLSARKKKSKFGEREFDGYYVDAADGRQYTIHSAVFRTWFADRHQLRLALDWLERRELLKPKVTEKTLDKTSSDWAEQTPKWPNGKSVRSIVFLDPESLRKKAGSRSK